MYICGFICLSPVSIFWEIKKYTYICFLAQAQLGCIKPPGIYLHNESIRSYTFTVVPLYWQVVSYLKKKKKKHFLFRIDWMEGTIKANPSAGDGDDAAKQHLEYCYCPFMCSPESCYTCRKYTQNHIQIMNIWKLRNNLFTCINRCYEEAKQCQYFISEISCKKTHILPCTEAECASL